MSALDESLLSLENLDRTSPELWPESSECDQPRSCSICLLSKRVGRLFPEGYCPFSRADRFENQK